MTQQEIDQDDEQDRREFMEHLTAHLKRGDFEGAASDVVEGLQNVIMDFAEVAFEVGKSKGARVLIMELTGDIEIVSPDAVLGIVNGCACVRLGGVKMLIKTNGYRVKINHREMRSSV
jgi:hypothetical protein